jgi:hypothetical protein
MNQTIGKEIVADEKLVAYCGLYCGACRSYLKGTCPGCAKNTKASWCKIKECCEDHHLKSCADCKYIPLAECKKYNTTISKLIGFVLNSDRAACILRIRELNYHDFALEMTLAKRHTIRRK